MIKTNLKKLEFKLRARLPENIKRIYRVLGLLRKPEYSKDVPQSLINDCKFICSRADLLVHMKKRAIVCEVGVYKGDFSRKIVERTAPERLHLIDINFSHFDDKELNKLNIVKHEGLSYEVMNEFQSNYFDWIYIDADHRYRGVLKDAEISHQKLKDGGYIIFNDFGHVGPNGSKFGVHRAAVEFSMKYDYKWKYLSYHKSALYDLAIQKPS